MPSSAPVQSRGRSDVKQKQIDAIIGEDFLPLGRHETDAISGYAELEQQSQNPKKPARVNQVA